MLLFSWKEAIIKLMEIGILASSATLVESSSFDQADVLRGWFSQEGFILVGGLNETLS